MSTWQGFRIVLFFDGLNEITPYATNIENTYLEVYTSDKIWIKATKLFGEQEDHLLLMGKALYGLQSSGLRFNKLLAKYLFSLEFVQSKYEADIWYWQWRYKLYEYVATYIDNLCTTVMEPLKLIEQLQSDQINFKLKSTANVEGTVYLGCRFAQHQIGLLYMEPGEYVSKIEDSYVHHFCIKPKQTVQSLSESGDHLELTVSERLDEDGIEIYQSLIGSMQCAVLIGRYDIHTAGMSMSGYRIQPRVGHLTCIRKMYWYLFRFWHYKIRFRTKEIDYFMIPYEEYDWDQTLYETNGCTTISR